MPEYCQIECYVEVGETGLPSILERYRTVLERLTGDLATAGELIAAFPIEAALNKSLIHPRERPRLRLKGPGPRLTVEPILLGWRATGRAMLQRPKLELSLLFHAEEIWEDDGSAYRVEAAAQLWRAVHTFFLAFNRPVFFTNEANEGKAWQTVSSGLGSIFVFDLACFPPGGIHTGHDVPFDYKLESAGGVDVAWHTARWTRPPYAD